MPSLCNIKLEETDQRCEPVSEQVSNTGGQTVRHWNQSMMCNPMNSLQTTIEVFK